MEPCLAGRLSRLDLPPEQWSKGGRGLPHQIKGQRPIVLSRIHELHTLEHQQTLPRYPCCASVCKRTHCKAAICRALRECKDGPREDTQRSWAVWRKR